MHDDGLAATVRQRQRANQSQRAFMEVVRQPGDARTLRTATVQACQP
jgi:hypothetical protein